MILTLHDNLGRVGIDFHLHRLHILVFKSFKLFVTEQRIIGYFYVVQYN